MCIPGYWLAGFYTPAAPRKLQVPLGWGTLGYAFPAALGAALAGTGPVVSISGDGGFLYAVRRAGDDRAGADPADRRDRRRRRLRDAALRPGAGRRGDLRRRPAHARLRRARRSPSACHAETVDGLDDAFGEALARHVADPAPSVLVARTPTPLVPPPNTSPNWYRRDLKGTSPLGVNGWAAARARRPARCSGCGGRRRRGRSSRGRRSTSSQRGDAIAGQERVAAPGPARPASGRGRRRRGYGDVRRGHPHLRRRSSSARRRTRSPNRCPDRVVAAVEVLGVRPVQAVHSRARGSASRVSISRCTWLPIRRYARQRHRICSVHPGEQSQVGHAVRAPSTVRGRGRAAGGCAANSRSADGLGRRYDDHPCPPRAVGGGTRSRAGGRRRRPRRA